VAACLLLLGACSVKPEETSPAERATRAEQDLAEVRAARYVPTGPINLYEAMARAVVLNIEHRVQQIEQDIAEAELEQRNYELLPELDIDVGATRQDQQTSVIQDRNVKTLNVGFAWNVLDLGVSYARAQQQANQVLIARERRRKAFNDILRDVRLAYWRAASASRLIREARIISARIQAGIVFSERMQASQVRDARTTVIYRRALLDSVRHVVAFRREISEVKAELGGLLRIPPGVEFTVLEPREIYQLPSVPWNTAEMERFALENRAEMRSADYQAQADEWRAREMVYDLLPGLDLNIGNNYSTDSYLLTNGWSATGAQLGFNLFNLFSLPGRRQAVETQAELAQVKRTALAMAVLTQVHLSQRQYSDAIYQFALTQRIGDADRRLTNLVHREAAIVQGGYLEAIEAAARALRTGLEEHRAFTEVVRAHSHLMHAVGVNVVPDSFESASVEEIAALLERHYTAWDEPTDKAGHLTTAPTEVLIEAALPSSETRSAETSPLRPAAAAPAATAPAATAPAAGRPQVQQQSSGARAVAALPPSPLPAAPQPVRAASAARSQPDAEAARVRMGRRNLEMRHYVAQVGAYRDPEAAADVNRRLVNDPRLRAIGDLVHIDTLVSPRHGMLHAVRIGPMFTRAEAVNLCAGIARLDLDCIPLQRSSLDLAHALVR